MSSGGDTAAGRLERFPPAPALETGKLPVLGADSTGASPPARKGFRKSYIPLLRLVHYVTLVPMYTKRRVFPSELEKMLAGKCPASPALLGGELHSNCSPRLFHCYKDAAPECSLILGLGPDVANHNPKFNLDEGALADGGRC